VASATLFHCSIWQRNVISIYFASVAVAPVQQLPPITFAVSTAGAPWHTNQDQYRGAP